MTALAGVRVPPLTTEQLDEPARAALRGAFPAQVADRFFATDDTGMRLPNALATMVRNPGVSGPFLAYNSVLLGQASIEPRLRELMVLRVAWRAGADYEWAQHVRLAARYDISSDEIAAIAEGADAGCWSPVEASALRATDELLDGYRVSDDTWQQLAGSLDDSQLIELLFVVGTYTALAMVFNSLGVERDPELLDAGIPPLPEGPGR